MEDSGLNWIQQEHTGSDVGALIPARLRGYRWFNHNGASPIGLGSTRLNERDHGIVWSPTMVAKCYPDPKRRWYATASCDAPSLEEGHACGIYGWYTPEHIHNHILGLDEMHVSVGVIEVEGRVLAGTKGFRAQRARIVAIAYPPYYVDPVRYRDAGIKVFDSAAAMVTAFAPQDVSNLVSYRTPTKGDALTLRRAINIIERERMVVERQLSFRRTVMSEYAVTKREYLRLQRTIDPDPLRLAGMEAMMTTLSDTLASLGDQVTSWEKHHG